jgi:hypothetical protein
MRTYSIQELYDFSTFGWYASSELLSNAEKAQVLIQQLESGISSTPAQRDANFKQLESMYPIFDWRGSSYSQMYSFIGGGASNDPNSGSGVPTPVSLYSLNGGNVNTAILPTPADGVSSEKRLPWDDQPDVSIDTPKEVSVQKTAFVNYTPTITNQYSEPPFLAWLVIQVPDRDTYNALLSGERYQGLGLSSYHAMWVSTLPAPQEPGAPLPPTKTVDYIESEVPATLQGKPQTGTGVIYNAPVDNKNNQDNQFMPLPLTPYTMDPKSYDTASDYVSLMQTLRADDFLNILGEKYQDTLSLIAADPSARATVNDLAQHHDIALESFIRNYKTPIAVPPQSQLPTTQAPGVGDEKVPTPTFVFNKKTVLTIIAIIIVGVVLYIFKKGGKK